MKNMTLSTVAEVCGGALMNALGVEQKEIAGVELDSRKIKQDFLFVATVGQRVDGHSFIDQIFEQGALGVLCEKEPVSPKGPYILVGDTFKALRQLAAWYRTQLDVKVIGITGSVGKTSTKEFVAAVLAQRFSVLKTEGNFNNEVGLPLTVLRIREYHQCAVLEMGISDFGEMRRLSEIAQPDICILTNIGPCHLEKLHSLEGVLQAKTEMFEFLRTGGTVCVNGDDALLRTVQEVYGKKPVTFGLTRENDIYAEDLVSQGLWGTRCAICTQVPESLCFEAEIPLPGQYMVYNALAATAAGHALSMSAQDIAAGLRTVSPLGGRSNILRFERFTVIDDCYNANPVSMRAALDLLSLAQGRKVALLGDMGELGTNEKELHHAIGKYAADKNIDVIVCTGTLSHETFLGAQESASGSAIFHYPDRASLLSALPSIVQDGDTVLVKASHFMDFPVVVEALKAL